jgi:SPOR domain
LTRYWARHWRSASLAPVIASLALILCAFGTSAAPGKPGEEGAAQAEAGAAGKPAAAKKKHDPAEGQRAVEQAGKLIEAGKTEQAIQALSATLTAGNLPPAIMAKALLYRGIAYRQQKKPAQAISDFTSALWLKGGLSESDRADGARQRAAAYAEAGLNQAGEAAPGAVAKETRSKDRPASSAPWSDGTTTSAPAQATALNQAPSAPAASGGGWNLFANLFSGGSGSAWATQAAAPAPPAAAPAPPPPAAAPAPAPPAAPRRETAELLPAQSPSAERAAPPKRTQPSGWSRQTQVESERGARIETAAITTKDEPQRRATIAPEPHANPGALRIQIAAVRTQAEAQALVTKVMREHAATLARREPQIDQTIMGNMGSFYRVLIGPFASVQETQNVCAKLKGTGLDCLVTAN